MRKRKKIVTSIMIILVYLLLVSSVALAAGPLAETYWMSPSETVLEKVGQHQYKPFNSCRI